MRCGEALKALLRPLGVYRLEGTLNGGELEAEGGALDGCLAELEEWEREMLLSTAEGAGLEAVESLLTRRPVADGPEMRRAALSALLRIGGDSFTLAAINDNLAGCGLNAAVSETEIAGTVAVRFPDVPGVPDGFNELKKIIEDIIPCHLVVRYDFWIVTWAILEERFRVWSGLAGRSWEGIERLVKNTAVRG